MPSAERLSEIATRLIWAIHDLELDDEFEDEFEEIDLDESEKKWFGISW